MSDENLGRVLAGKYELVRLLGKGGMGAVYEGKNQIGKRVAIKLLLEPQFVSNPDLVARFFREAQASAAVESKHVVDVYDTGIDEASGIPFMIMAFLQGEDLQQMIARVGPVNPVAAVRIASQAAAGLAKAHAAGIIHRDIKPANLFLAIGDGDCVVKILDFGIAKVTAEKLSRVSITGPNGGSGGVLTNTGALLGTPLYMSPEQAQGLKTIDERTDVWSLGLCLYEALAGRLPFGDVDTIGKLIVSIVSQKVKPLTDLAPWVRPELAAVVHKALERDVDQRIASAKDFMAALAPLMNGGLSLPPTLLVAVQETLDQTLTPGAAASNPRLQVGAPATAPGISTDPGPLTKRGGGQRTLIVGGLALLALCALTLGKTTLSKLTTDPQNESTSAQGGTSAAPLAPPPVVPAPPVLPSAAIAPESKVGVLTLKVPEGFSVTVDGVLPGAPDSDLSARRRSDGNLELRGEFQRKFLVAVLDKSGKRLFVQDVYLYDNKLDPDTIDTGVGLVTVEKPKRKHPSVPSVLPAASSSDGLPPRF